MKIILLGDSFTGKTNLLNIYIKNEPPNYNVVNLPTIGVDFGTKEISTNDLTKVKIQCWDTAGQESYRTIIRGYYRNTGGIILFFNLTRYDSFNNLKDWLNEIKTYTTCDHEHPILLLGTHQDAHDKRVIKKIDAINFAEQHNLLYYELNTFDYDSIDRMFKCYIGKVLNKIKDTDCKGIRQLNSKEKNILSIERESKIKIRETDDKTCCIIS